MNYIIFFCISFLDSSNSLFSFFSFSMNVLCNSNALYTIYIMNIVISNLCIAVKKD